MSWPYSPSTYCVSPTVIVPGLRAAGFDATFVAGLRRAGDAFLEAAFGLAAAAFRTAGFAFEAGVFFAAGFFAGDLGLLVLFAGIEVLPANAHGAVHRLRGS